MNNTQLLGSAALPGALPIASAKSGANATYALFGSPTLAASAAVAIVTNQVVYTPIFVPFKIKVAALGAFFTGVQSYNFRCALYAIGSDGLPGSLIYDFGAFQGSTTISPVTSNGPTLTRGWYYLATNSSSSSTSVFGYAQSNVPSLVLSGLLPIVADPIYGASTGAPAVLNAAAQPFGAFPGTATAPTTNFASFQIAQMQAA